MNKYDILFIGAGPHVILEALSQSIKGKRVLMAERTDGIGGAWRPLNLFGINNVENAIHYFLYNEAAFDFMRECLGWDITKTKNKYRQYKTILGAKRFGKYDSFWVNSLNLIRNLHEIDSVCSSRAGLVKKYQNFYTKDHTT